ncbi:hypothetical protein AHAS_Ahas02G0146300 [Arachis hypogaea]
MRMVKEILGQSVVVEAFCFEASRRLCHTRQNNNKKHKISMFPSFSCSSILLPIVKRRTTFDDLISSNKSLHDGGGVTLTISASVAIKNSKEFMAMMLHYFDSFSHNTTGDRGIVMQLVSTQIDPTTMEGKLSKRAVLDWTRELLFNGGGDSERSTHKVEFEIDSNFGFPGAITVTNKYDKEIFLETISIEGGFVEFSCNSWVQPEKVHPDKRIFFTNKACLPCDTAEGVKELRKEELRQKRGDGNGMRKVMSDRVYDYDVYNDLGNLDKGIQHVRPILGTKQHPNPRRCRTGRPPVITNEKYESCVNAFMETYVPRDEVFEGVRKEALDVERVKGVTRNLIPFIRTYITKCGVFKELSEIKNIYKRRHQVDAMNHTNEENGTLSIDVNKLFQDSFEEYFKFSTPHIISGNGGCCITDEELGRQALAGVNPLSIKRLQTFPPVSDLDPSMYGPQESALKEEHIISHLDGMSVQQAIEEKKLFILDYHDAYMPFLKGINAQEDRKAYATRTILYLTRMGTLKPIAIELSLPEGEHQQQQSKQVLTPPLDATSYWLWQLAKAHVCSNDAGVHQLVHHWLRTHACMEPFIIAAHRQMSVTHPIFKLLKPHMKYTLQINALAREALINGGGIIESDFSTGRYSTEIISAAYKDWWRFDMEALPADLIRRGLAEPDRAQPHGIKLTIEDYPYANDGLLIVGLTVESSRQPGDFGEESSERT